MSSSVPRFSVKAPAPPAPDTAVNGDVYEIEMNDDETVLLTLNGTVYVLGEDRKWAPVVPGYSTIRCIDCVASDLSKRYKVTVVEGPKTVLEYFVRPSTRVKIKETFVRWQDDDVTNGVRLANADAAREFHQMLCNLVAELSPYAKIQKKKMKTKGEVGMGSVDSGLDVNFGNGEPTKSQTPGDARPRTSSASKAVTAAKPEAKPPAINREVSTTSVTSLGSDSGKDVVTLHVTLPSNESTHLKSFPEMPLRQVVERLCSLEKLEVGSHTLQYADVRSDSLVLDGHVGDLRSFNLRLINPKDSKRGAGSQAKAAQMEKQEKLQKGKFSSFMSKFGKMDASLKSSQENIAEFCLNTDDPLWTKFLQLLNLHTGELLNANVRQMVEDFVRDRGGLKYLKMANDSKFSQRFVEDANELAGIIHARSHSPTPKRSISEDSHVVFRSPPASHRSASMDDDNIRPYDMPGLSDGPTTLDRKAKAKRKAPQPPQLGNGTPVDHAESKTSAVDSSLGLDLRLSQENMSAASPAGKRPAPQAPERLSQGSLDLKSPSRSVASDASTSLSSLSSPELDDRAFHGERGFLVTPEQPVLKEKPPPLFVPPPPPDEPPPEETFSPVGPLPSSPIHDVTDGVVRSKSESAAHRSSLSPPPKVSEPSNWRPNEADVEGGAVVGSHRSASESQSKVKAKAQSTTDRTGPKPDLLAKPLHVAKKTELSEDKSTTRARLPSASKTGERAGSRSSLSETSTAVLNADSGVLDNPRNAKENATFMPDASKAAASARAKPAVPSKESKLSASKENLAKSTNIGDSKKENVSGVKALGATPPSLDVPEQKARVLDPVRPLQETTASENKAVGPPEHAIAPAVVQANNGVDPLKQMQEILAQLQVLQSQTLNPQQQQMLLQQQLLQQQMMFQLLQQQMWNQQQQPLAQSSQWQQMQPAFPITVMPYSLPSREPVPPSVSGAVSVNVSQPSVISGTVSGPAGNSPASLQTAPLISDQRAIKSTGVAPSQVVTARSDAELQPLPAPKQHAALSKEIPPAVSVNVSQPSVISGMVLGPAGNASASLQTAPLISDQRAIKSTGVASGQVVAARSDAELQPPPIPKQQASVTAEIPPDMNLRSQAVALKGISQADSALRRSSLSYPPAPGAGGSAAAVGSIPPTAAVVGASDDFGKKPPSGLYALLKARSGGVPATSRPIDRERPSGVLLDTAVVSLLDSTSVVDASKNGKPNENKTSIAHLDTKRLAVGIQDIDKERTVATVPIPDADAVSVVFEANSNGIVSSTDKKPVLVPDVPSKAISTNTYKESNDPVGKVDLRNGDTLPTPLPSTAAAETVYAKLELAGKDVADNAGKRSLLPVTAESGVSTIMHKENGISTDGLTPTKPVASAGTEKSVVTTKIHTDVDSRNVETLSAKKDEANRVPNSHSQITEMAKHESRVMGSNSLALEDKISSLPLVGEEAGSGTSAKTHADFNLATLQSQDISKVKTVPSPLPDAPVANTVSMKPESIRNSADRLASLSMSADSKTATSAYIEDLGQKEVDSPKLPASSSFSRELVSGKLQEGRNDREVNVDAITTTVPVVAMEPENRLSSKKDKDIKPTAVEITGLKASANLPAPKVEFIDPKPLLVTPSKTENTSNVPLTGNASRAMEPDDGKGSKPSRQVLVPPNSRPSGVNELKQEPIQDHLPVKPAQPVPVIGEPSKIFQVPAVLGDKAASSGSEHVHSERAEALREPNASSLAPGPAIQLLPKAVEIPVDWNAEEGLSPRDRLIRDIALHGQPTIPWTVGQSADLGSKHSNTRAIVPADKDVAKEDSAKAAAHPVLQNRSVFLPGMPNSRIDQARGSLSKDVPKKDNSASHQQQAHRSSDSDAGKVPEQRSSFDRINSESLVPDKIASPIVTDAKPASSSLEVPTSTLPLRSTSVSHPSGLPRNVVPPRGLGASLISLEVTRNAPPGSAANLRQVDGISGREVTKTAKLGGLSFGYARDAKVAVANHAADSSSSALSAASAGKKSEPPSVAPKVTSARTPVDKSERADEESLIKPSEMFRGPSISARQLKSQDSDGKAASVLSARPDVSPLAPTQATLEPAVSAANSRLRSDVGKVGSRNSSSIRHSRDDIEEMMKNAPAFSKPIFGTKQ